MSKHVPETNCEQECKFKFGPEFKTLVYYEPLYDKNGNILSKDTNTVTGVCDCIMCGKHWAYITAHNKTIFTEWNKL